VNPCNGRIPPLGDRNLGNEGHRLLLLCTGSSGFFYGQLVFSSMAKEMHIRPDNFDDGISPFAIWDRARGRVGVEIVTSVAGRQHDDTKVDDELTMS